MIEILLKLCDPIHDFLHDGCALVGDHVEFMARRTQTLLEAAVAGVAVQLDAFCLLV